MQLVSDDTLVFPNVLAKDLADWMRDNGLSRVEVNRNDYQLKVEWTGVQKIVVT